MKQNVTKLEPIQISKFNASFFMFMIRGIISFRLLKSKITIEKTQKNFPLAMRKVFLKKLIL